MKFNEQQIMEFAKLFDDIITSESVAVQSAFQRLTLLNALAKSEKDNPGPFEQLVRQMDWMEHELSSMRRDLQILQNNNLTNGHNTYKIDTGQIVNLGMNTGAGAGSLTAYDLTAIQPISALNIATITLPDSSI